MGRRTIWRPTGASYAATSISVLFPILLHLIVLPFFTAASDSNITNTTTSPANTTTGLTNTTTSLTTTTTSPTITTPSPTTTTTNPTTTTLGPTCECNATSFCYNNTCQPFLNLKLQVLPNHSNGLTFSWSIINEKKSLPNVSLDLKCEGITACSCNKSIRTDEFSRNFTITNFDSSSLLVFKAVAKWNDTIVSNPINKRVLTAPVLPDNITFSDVNSTTVKVAWTTYEQCIDTRLEIRRNASDTILSNTSINEGELLIRSLNPGSINHFQTVAVVNADEKMERSKTITRSVTTPPLPPEGLTVTPKPFSLNVTFTPPSIGRYDFFELEYRLGNNGNWTAADNANASNFSIVSGLQPFLMYSLRARTVSYDRFSSYYEKNVTTSEFKPSVPTIVDHNNSLVIWKPTDTPNGIILFYELQWTLFCGKFVQVKSQVFNVSAQNRSWPMPSGFELPGYRHCVRIRAKNSYSFSNFSATSCSSRSVDSTLGQELNVTASSDTASITWSSTTCSKFVVGYFLLLQRRNPYSSKIMNPCLPGSRRLSCSNCNTSDLYELFSDLTSDCGGVAKNKTFENEITKINLTSLQPGDIYHVTLFSAGSNRSLHNISRNFSTQQVKSSQPESISVTTVSDKTLAVNWSHPTTPGGLVLYYLAWLDTKMPRCFLCNCIGCERRFDFVNLTVQSQQQLDKDAKDCQRNCNFEPERGPRAAVKFDNLTAFTNFTVYVSAVNSLGSGRNNASAIGWTRQGRPDPPTWVNITAVTEATVTVVWSTSPNLRGILKEYFAQLNSSSGSKSIIHTGTETSKTFTNLTACTQYVASVTVANEEQKSSSVISETKFTNLIRPTAVANLELHVRNSSSLRATWNAIENVGNCEVKYKVVLWKGGIQKENLTTVKVAHDFEKLNPDTEYTVEVVAIVTSSDGRRRESPARNFSHTTKEGIPTAPQKLACSSENHTSFSCSWSKPTLTNGKIQAYEVSVEPAALNSPLNVSGTTLNTILTMPKTVSSWEIIEVFVKAFTSAGPGNSVSFKTQLIDGPPDTVKFTEEIKREMTKDANNVDNKETQVRINYKTGWFKSNRGKIVHLTMVVSECCPKSFRLTGSGTKLDDDLSTWFASDAGRSNPYAAVKIKVNQGRRRKRSISAGFDHVLIGEDNNCPKMSKEYCNGPLKPGTNYSIYLRGYTSNGFSTVGPVIAKTSKPTSNNLVIGLVIGFLLIVAMAVAGFFVFRWWRNRPRDKDPKSTSGNGVVNPWIPGGMEMRPFSDANASAPDLALMVSEGREVEVPLQHFEEFVEEMNRDSCLKYSAAFSEVKKKAQRNEAAQGLTVEEAGQQYNRLKNRFANVLPFDQTRVCLSSDDDPFSGMDYINANFVAGYRRQREFIACQGPLPQTLEDFWRMLWEQNVSLIVMLTKTVEKGRNKCEQYWPTEVNETRVYGDIAVCLESESVVNSHVVRVCSLTLKGESRRLTHLQMLTWDDFLAPSPQDLTDFMRAYRSHLPPPNGNRSEAPTVVHCSAGVGRTGTFICLDTLIRRLESGHSSINVNAVIYAMRKQRRMLVQSERQYIFIHDFLVSYLRQRLEAAARSLHATEEEDGSTALLDATASHVNNAYETEDIL